MTSFFFLLLLLALAQLLCPVLSSSTGSLCILMYSLPGTVDYPFSIAYNLQLTYDPASITSANQPSLSLSSVSGMRTYTNRFGVAISASVQVSGGASISGFAGSLFAIAAKFYLGDVVQLPGVGAMTPASAVYLQIANGTFIMESGQAAFPENGLYPSVLVDPNSQAYLSSIPGFTNTTIASSNINALAVRYSSCVAPVTFINGLRTPVEPAASNSALLSRYGYTISDNTTYSVTTSLTLTMSSQFAVSQDSLGNPYQTVIGIVGTRNYTNLTSGVTTTQNVTGLAQSGNFNEGFPIPTNNTFHPYALLGAAPGVYSIHTAPFLDGEGIVYATSATSAVQVMLMAPRSRGDPQQSAVNEWVYPNYFDLSVAPTPLLSLQQQTYALL